VKVLVAIAFAATPALASSPVDPYFTPYQSYAYAIGLPQAWDYSTGSSSIVVAVLDSGVNTSTPDLQGRILPAFSTSGYGPLDGATVPHGTQVASVAAMGVNNGIGGAGVGNFSILPVTVTNDSGANTPYWIADGIRQSAAAGARVIVISLDTLTYGPVEQAAAEVASSTLVFVAAGNSNSLRTMPGEYANLIFVSGTTGDERATWSGGGSSWGDYVDLAAPATQILVADPMLGTSGYGLGNGTSYAAPLAAGAAALAWSINPTLTPDEVRTLLYSTATDLGEPGWDPVFGHGRINVGALAASAAATVPEPSTLALLFLIALLALCRRYGVPS
jgi:subtilisin family serine protease